MVIKLIRNGSLYSVRLKCTLLKPLQRNMYKGTMFSNENLARVLQIILFVFYHKNLFRRECGLRVRYKSVHSSKLQPHVYTVNFNHLRQQQCGGEKLKVWTIVVITPHEKYNGHCSWSVTRFAIMCAAKGRNNSDFTDCTWQMSEFRYFYSLILGNVSVTIRSISMCVL